MANETLRAALQNAGLQPDDLADIVEVDVRTVRRWLAGRTPYPRQRGKVARALDLTEHQLWPETALNPPSRKTASKAPDPIAGYPSASDLDAPDWKALMRDATDRIELLGETLDQILATPGVPELLIEKAAAGCEIRILVDDPRPHLASLLDRAGLDVRLLEDLADLTTYRFDEQLLLLLRLLALDQERRPLLHLRRAAPGGLFDRLSEHFQYLWEDDSRPINLDDLQSENGHEQDDGDDYDTDATADDTESPPATDAPAPDTPPPRRWPRRQS